MRQRVLILVMSVPNLSDPIPTGPWTLYFHQADAERWTLDTFIKVNTFLIAVP
jgi:hypothetical protein